MKKIAGWVFDHERGPLQTGTWGGEEIDGLMMGWRGETRELAMSSAYSMETLMPLQFLLPSVRYCPALADAVGKFVRCALSNFQLFYAQGAKPLYETQPDLSHAIPYEKLMREMDGHTPAACGDFCGARSVYGAGYLYWLEALARPTDDPDLFALDLSLTDWLTASKYPVFLLRNPKAAECVVRFTPASVWRTVRPALYRDGRLACALWDLPSASGWTAWRDAFRLRFPPAAYGLPSCCPKALRPSAPAASGRRTAPSFTIHSPTKPEGGIILCSTPRKNQRPAFH